MEPLLLWGLGLLAVALLIVIVDIFLPTAGVLSITAALVSVAGVICLWRYDTIWGLIGTIIVLAGGPALFFFGMSIMPNTPIGRKMIPKNPGETEDGSRGPSVAQHELGPLVGREATVLTDLRPIGTIRIDGKRYDALAELAMIRAGSTVKVVAVEDAQLKVRAV